MLISSLLLFLSFFTPQVYSQDDVTLNAELEAKTKYVWRAIYVGPEPFVFQPSGTLFVSDFNFSVWANMDADPGQITVNEINYTISYYKKFGSFGIEPAFIYYAYPIVYPNSGDISLKLDYTINDNFIVYNTHYLSVLGKNGIQNNAYYVDLGIQYTKQLLEELSIQTNISFAFVSPRFNLINADVEEGGAENIIFDIQLPYYVTKNIYIRPRTTFSTLLKKSVRDALSPNQKTTTLVFCFAIGADI